MSNPDSNLLPFSALGDTGLLWLINTSVFHPRGLMFALQIDDDGEAIGWELIAAPTGEAYTFSLKTDANPYGVDIDDAYRRAEAFMESVRSPERVNAPPAVDPELIEPLRAELTQLMRNAPTDLDQLSVWYVRLTEVMTSVRSLMVRGEPSESPHEQQDEHDDQQDADDAPDEVVGVRHEEVVPGGDATQSVEQP